MEVSKQTQRETEKAKREREEEMAGRFELGGVKQPKEEAVEIEPSSHDLPNIKSNRYFDSFCDFC